MSEPVLSLNGVFPPIPTPFDLSGDVDHRALRDNILNWNRYDLAGYAVLGSNGEAAYLSTDERTRVLETAREAIPQDKVLIAGTGGESTRQTVALTHQAAEVGADAALVITPHFFDGKMTSDSLVGYYCAVADASPIPVLLYNVPKFTHVDMDAAAVARAAGHPNIIGIKDSGGNVAKLADMIRLTEPGFQVLAGSAGFFFPALALGAVGGVLALANVAPQQCIDIHRLFQAGQWDAAAALQRCMVPVNAAITARFGVAGLKAALDLLGYVGGPVRQPLLDLDVSDHDTLRAVLSAGGLL
jgi:4-hydroxy-2-oxoglutarate aldolase